jgi:hypothetical protein
MAGLRRPGAMGLYLLPGGWVMVDYGSRRIPIRSAQYRVNGYRPLLEKLALKSRGSARQVSVNDLSASVSRRPPVAPAPPQPPARTA